MTLPERILTEAAYVMIGSGAAMMSSPDWLIRVCAATFAIACFVAADAKAGMMGRRPWFFRRLA